MFFQSSSRKNRLAQKSSSQQLCVSIHELTCNLSFHVCSMYECECTRGRVSAFKKYFFYKIIIYNLYYYKKNNGTSLDVVSQLVSSFKILQSLIPRRHITHTAPGGRIGQISSQSYERTSSSVVQLRVVSICVQLLGCQLNFFSQSRVGNWQRRPVSRLTNKTVVAGFGGRGRGSGSDGSLLLLLLLLLLVLKYRAIITEEV